MGVLVVPVKSLSGSKSRLSTVLSARERAELTVALFEDTLDSCLAQAGWETWVISSDESLRVLAGRRGARPVLEGGRSLLAAVRQVQQEAAWASELAVLLSDLPYLTPAELAEALAEPGPVVAAPSASDGGTNLLVRRPPAAIPARFGRDSFAKHRWAARRAGLALTEVRRPGLEQDLDRPEDLVRLIRSGREGRTLSACTRMGLRLRLLLDAAEG